MGTAKWQPKYWTKDNSAGWDSVKEAFRRDWEQTKADLHAGGKDLNQGVTDTIEQAGGAEKIPAGNAKNTTETRGRSVWDDVEEPMQYGFAAREYGKSRDFSTIEGELKSDWDDSRREAGERWEDVKRWVRHAYEGSAVKR